MEGLCILLGDKYRKFILQEMTISVNYNASTLTLNRSLSNATFALSKALNRMSTGFRVNSAADDAAGLYVATGMRTQIGGLNQAKKNTQIGVNLLNTAQGGLSEMNKLLSRIRDLSVQASNGVYGKNERDAMQKEIDALTEQYNQIKKGTNFNGLYLFETPENTGVTTYASTLASRLSTNSNWKVNAPKDSSSVPERTPPLSAPKAPVSQEEPPTENLPSVGEITPEEGELPEPEPYNPGVQLTGKEMNALKSWLAAGEKYEDFSSSIAKGMSATEILSSKGIEQTTNKALRAADPKSGAGTVDFNGGETKVVAIEGVNYTIKNTQPIAKSIIWSKNDAGEITFEGTNFEIRGQSDASHNVELKLSKSTFYGGDKDDIINLSVQPGVIYPNLIVYAGGGNDIVNNRASHMTHVYLQSGNNTYNGFNGNIAFITGGVGKDTYNLIGTHESSTLKTGDGDNVINLSGYWKNIATGKGNNTINLKNGSSSSIINSGNGNDTYNFLDKNIDNITLIDTGGANVIDNTINNIKTNNLISGNFTINGANPFIRAFKVDLAANEEKRLTMADGKSYTIKNDAKEKSMLWKMVGDTLTWVQGSGVTMRANEATKINLREMGGTFYGSDESDTISGNSTIYSGAGDDIISLGNGVVYLQGGNNTVTVTGAGTVYGGDGNDTFNLNTANAKVFGGSGNGIFNMNSMQAMAYGGSGNNVFNLNVNGTTGNGGSGNDKFVIKAGVKNVNCIGGGGTNTVEGNLAGALWLADMSNAINNAMSVLLASDKTTSTNVDINGANYEFKNFENFSKYIAYAVGADDTVSLIGMQFSAQAQLDKYHKIDNYGAYQHIRGGNVGNTITRNAYGGLIWGGLGDDTFICNSDGGTMNIPGNGNNFYGVYGNNTFILNKNAEVNTGNGNNKLVLNAGLNSLTAGTGNNYYVINTNNLTMTNGGQGNNIYEINGNNCNITAGIGNDSFIVNGNNNQVFGAAGDDFFNVSSGSSNNVIGGSGTNYLVDNGIGTVNSTGDVTKARGGKLDFTFLGEGQSFNFEGKTYTVSNSPSQGGGSAANSLTYILNQNTGELMFYGDNLTIKADDTKENNMVVYGSNNIIETGSQNDKIQIVSGTGNKIISNGGMNNIVINTQNNEVIGGTGSDFITINADNNKIIGTTGSMTINANSDNNTILGGSGRDSITVTGALNTIDGGNGDDKIIVYGEQNTVNTSGGNNNFTFIGDKNTLNETGNGNNTVAVDGENNNVTLGNGNNKVSVITLNTVTTGNTITTGNGNNSFNVQGNKNQITTGTGQDSFDLNGNDNKINSGDGNNTVNVTFGTGNTIDTGSGADKITVKSDSNLVKSGAGNDSITVSGNQNNVSSSSGENNFQINGNNNQIQGGSDKDNIYLTGDNNIAKGGDGNDRFNIRLNAKDNNIDGEIGNNTMINYGTDTVFANVKDITSDIEIRLQVGANGDANSAIFFKTDFIAEDLIVDVSSVDNALAGIELLDNIINTISEKRSELGAVESRLDSVLTSQTTQVENLTAAVSTIMDADIAEESALYVKNQILQQSSAALMSASANFSKNLVLQLLQ